MINSDFYEKHRQEIYEEYCTRYPNEITSDFILEDDCNEEQLEEIIKELILMEKINFKIRLGVFSNIVVFNDIEEVKPIITYIDQLEKTLDKINMEIGILLQNSKATGNTNVPIEKIKTINELIENYGKEN